MYICLDFMFVRKLYGETCPLTFANDAIDGSHVTIPI